MPARAADRRRGERDDRPGSRGAARRGHRGAARCRPTRCSTPRRARATTPSSAMYHDQALIPLKTLDFERGVNVTLGLPFVRTSPDHGTAFEIAGTGRADPASLIAALRSPPRSARRARRAARAAEPRRRGPAPPACRRCARSSARRALGAQETRPAFPARPQPDAAHRARRRRRSQGTVIEVGPGPGGLTRALLAGRRGPCRRGRARRALPAGARRMPSAIPAGSRSTTATRSKPTGAALGAGAGQPASSPTCPTTSRRRC